jgi:hypothetical protein
MVMDISGGWEEGWLRRDRYKSNQSETPETLPCLLAVEPERENKACSGIGNEI